MEKTADIHVCDWCLGSAEYQIGTLRACTNCILNSAEALQSLQTEIGSLAKWPNPEGYPGVDDLGPNEIMFLAHSEQWDDLLSRMLLIEPRIVWPSKELPIFIIEHEEQFKELLSNRSVHAVEGYAYATMMARSLLLMKIKAKQLDGELLIALAKDETAVRSLTRGLDLIREAAPGMVEIVQSKILAMEQAQKSE